MSPSTRGVDQSKPTECKLSERVQYCRHFDWEVCTRPCASSSCLGSYSRLRGLVICLLSSACAAASVMEHSSQRNIKQMRGVAGAGCSRANSACLSTVSLVFWCALRCRLADAPCVATLKQFSPPMFMSRKMPTMMPKCRSVASSYVL